MYNIQNVFKNRKYCIKITQYCDKIDTHFSKYSNFMTERKFSDIETALDSVYCIFLGKTINNIFISENANFYNDFCEAIGFDILDYGNIDDEDREMFPLFHFYLIKNTIKTLDDLIYRFDKIILPELPIIGDMLTENGIIPKLIRKKRSNTIDFYKSNKRLLKQLFIIAKVFDIPLKN